MNNQERQALISDVKGRIQQIKRDIAGGWTADRFELKVAKIALAALETPHTECEKLKYIRRLERKLSVSKALLSEVSLSLLDKNEALPDPVMQPVKLPELETWRKPDGVRAQGAYRVLVKEAILAAGYPVEE